MIEMSHQGCALTSSAAVAQLAAATPRWTPRLCLCVLVSDSWLAVGWSYTTPPLCLPWREAVWWDKRAGSESGGMRAVLSAPPYDANCNRTGTAGPVCEHHCYSSTYCLPAFWQSPSEWEPVKLGGSPSLDPFMSFVMQRRGYCTAIGDFQPNWGRRHNDKDKFCLCAAGPAQRPPVTTSDAPLNSQALV